MPIVATTPTAKPTSIPRLNHTTTPQSGQADQPHPSNASDAGSGTGGTSPDNRHDVEASPPSTAWSHAAWKRSRSPGWIVQSA